jgi:hypothetical protein
VQQVCCEVTGKSGVTVPLIHWFIFYPVDYLAGYILRIVQQKTLPEVLLCH